MKNCPTCQTANLDTAQFCHSCATPFPALRFCPRCGASLSNSARFCQICGAPLPPSSLLGGSQVGGGMTGQLPTHTLLGGRYLILRKLGQGGMGAVYQATDNHLSDKLVALKEMSDAALVDPVEKGQALDAFRQEARLLSALSHPNLPRVTDYFSQGSRQYLAMDFVEGHTLSDLLGSCSTPFPETLVLQWADQLCDVLHYLHGRTPPIVFRDLKPANIMVAPDQKNIKLIDFGIARLFKPGARKDTITLGTPGYAPPEQYGKSQSDARSDVYALGATLHHLLSLRDPGDQPFKFPPLRTLNLAVSPQVEAAVMRAVEQDPALRWSSIQDFHDALHKAAPALQPAPRVITATPIPASARSMAAPVVYTQTARAVPASPAAPALPYAGHGPRLAAFLIDAVIFIGVSFFLLFVASRGSVGTLILTFCLLLIGLLGYYTFFHARSGQTPGKKLVKIKVVRRDGSRLGGMRAFWRTSVFLGPTLFFPLLLLFATSLNLLPSSTTCLLGSFLLSGFICLWPLFHNQHRAFHDLLSDTCVIKA